MSHESDFDPTAPLPGPPDPWQEAPTPSLRPGPPFHMTDMIAAEPALAGRILDRLAAPDGDAARLAADDRRDALCRRTDRGHRLRHLRAWSAGHRRDPARGGLVRRLRARGHPRGAGVRALACAAEPWPGHRRLARRRDRRHERGTPGGAGRRPAHRGDHGQPALPRRDARVDRGRDGRARPGLVPHGRLPESDRRGSGCRRAPVRTAPRYGRGHAPALRGCRRHRERRRDRRTPRRRRTSPRRRVRRGPAGRPRTRPEGRGGVLAALRLSRPGDVPPRPSAGHRLGDRAGARPDRSRATR